MIRDIKAGMIVKHFKGNIYEVICIAKHTETLEDFVVYKDVNNELNIYARPLEMFNSLVDKEKYPKVNQKYRFEVVN